MKFYEKQPITNDNKNNNNRPANHVAQFVSHVPDSYKINNFLKTQYHVTRYNNLLLITLLRTRTDGLLAC